jgi:Glycosyltransferases involved in cell wall biogenesis
MNIQPKVSIQIPTYNQQDYIENAIESALTQNYDNIEIIVADDCSTDGTAGIIKKFENNVKVKCFKNEINLGRVANYHKALYEYCTGEWVVNLDGDDYFTDPDFITHAIELITTNTDHEIYVFQGNHNLKKLRNIFSQSIAIREDAIMVDGADYFIKFYKVQHFTHCATLFKRSKALQLNFYSFDCLFTDLNSMGKLFLKGKIILSNRKVAMWRWYSANQSHSLSEQNIRKELDSITDMAKYARPYLPHDAIGRWEKMMKKYIETVYIELLINKPRRRSSLRYILRKFTWDIIYFKQLIKYFIRI